MSTCRPHVGTVIHWGAGKYANLNTLTSVSKISPLAITMCTANRFKLWFMLNTWMWTNCYAARALRFAYNSSMVQVTAFRLSCVVEVTPCSCTQVNMRIWIPYRINENCSHYTHSLIIIYCITDNFYWIFFL